MRVGNRAGTLAAVGCELIATGLELPLIISPTSPMAIRGRLIDSYWIRRLFITKRNDGRLGEGLGIRQYTDFDGRQIADIGRLGVIQLVLDALLIRSTTIRRGTMRQGSLPGGPL